MDAICPRHPEAMATAICARCGSYGCDACLTATATGGIRCPACLAPEDRDDLDTFVADRRGRPDAYVGWLGSGLTVLFIVSLLFEVERLLYLWRFPSLEPPVVTHLAIYVAGIVSAVGYLLRRRWSRWAIALPPAAELIDEIVFLTSDHLHIETPERIGLVVTMVAYVLLVGLVILAWRSPVNRLAFGLEVPRARLESGYRAWRRNRLAIVALVLSIATALVPFGFLVSLAPASVAWWRSRWPGVRHRGLARAAVILCLPSMAITITLLVVYFTAIR